METHPDCTFCFTNGKIIDMLQGSEERIFIPFSKENKDYFNNSKAYDVGSLGLLGFIPTASFMFRKSILENLPEFYYKRYPAGDMKLKLYATSKGYAYFINYVTCVYRANVKGSAMSSWKKYNKEQSLKHNQGYIDLINEVDEYTNFQYAEELDKLKLGFEVRMLFLKKQKSLIKEKKFREWLKKQNIFVQLKIITSLYLPNLYNFLKRTIKK